MISYLIIIYSFFFIMAVRFLLYFSKYLYLRKVIRKQDLYVRSLFKNATEDEIKIGNKVGAWVNDNLIEIKKVVLKTGVEDYLHTYMDPIGYGHVQQKTMSALDNLLYRNIDILKEARDVLCTARGYYKVETLKSINPIYWIEFIVFLPREIVKYFSSTGESKSSSVIIKVVQVIYWIVSVVFMYLNYKKGL